jgi:hypothetical protein
MTDDLDRRQAKIRERQLLLALEQWGPDYVFHITEATGAEKKWLEQQVAENGAAQATPRDWPAVRRAQGREANAAATAAFLAGDYERAHDLVDDARAYGTMTETEWRQLHAFIATQR